MKSADWDAANISKSIGECVGAAAPFANIVTISLVLVSPSIEMQL